MQSKPNGIRLLSMLNGKIEKGQHKTKSFYHNPIQIENIFHAKDYRKGYRASEYSLKLCFWYI
jgi:hypothetical protein